MKQRRKITATLTKEQIRERRLLMEEEHPGYLNASKKLWYPVAVLFALRILECMMIGGMGIYSPAYILGMMFGCIFTWVWFYLIFNWSWKLAIAFFCLTLKDMVTASSDMLNVIQYGISPIVKAEGVLTLVEFLFLLIFYLVIMCSKNIHEIQKTNKKIHTATEHIGKIPVYKNPEASFEIAEEEE